MYMLYLDETGINASDTHLILGGVIVDAKNWKDLNEAITNIKKEYFSSVYVELKGLRRYKSETLDDRRPNPFHNMDKNTRDEFSRKLKNIIHTNKFIYIAAIVNKKKLTDKYVRPYDPYILAYKFLIERFDNYLISKEDNGIIYIEFSNRSLKDNLEEAHNIYASTGTGFQEIKKIVESCHFVIGPKNNFVQVSDLFINSVFLKYEYSKDIIFNQYMPYVYADEHGNKDGWGIKYFP